MSSCSLFTMQDTPISTKILPGLTPPLLMDVWLTERSTGTVGLSLTPELAHRRSDMVNDRWESFGVNYEILVVEPSQQDPIRQIY